MQPNFGWMDGLWSSPINWKILLNLLQYFTAGRKGRLAINQIFDLYMFFVQNIHNNSHFFTDTKDP